MGRLQDKIAIVTGGGSGIGRSIVETFLSEGAKVIAIDINDDYLKTVTHELNEIYPGSCIGRVCNVTKGSQVTELINSAWDEFGKVDILVNNAGGSMNHSIHLLDITEEMWDQVFDLNAKSVFFCSQTFLRKHMHNDSTGVIVNMASQSAIVPNESMRPHYSAAKAGVIGLTKHMSKEFGPLGFRVNAVAPGYCKSGERIAKIWESRDTKSILRNVALRRTSTPEEQAAAVLFLSSDEASYITGVVLDVNGGGF
ncbi:SDR family NAD(P)-dependent oxidoreductase [Fredinandcohnia onubensis]|uniref:SDR family NAD(P)-dependent oxidoreductase n=1 Tax=Fredinandcohnia onubensis TaxID=1571209 RepID=UPI000C0BF7D8|nr:SDR family oxidoreductase [Fredinandcohnia onubensis]